jgi:hypothetical protein
MLPTIGTTRCGRMARGFARARRRAPFGLEALEPRLLLTGHVSSPTLGQLRFIPAEVTASSAVTSAASDLPWADSPVAPVVLSTGVQELDGTLQPGSWGDFYQISVGPATGTLWLDLTWDTLPPGTSGHLSVFDQGGKLLSDSSPVTASGSAAVILLGPFSSPDTVLYVRVRMSGPGGAGGAPLQGTYRLQFASYSFAPTGVNCGVGSVGGASSPHSPPTTSLPVNGSGPVGPVRGRGEPVGVRSSGSGPSNVGPRVASVSVPGPSPSTPAITGAAALTTDNTGTDAPASASLGTPIDVSPLPASPYEPAGGIFSVGGSTAGADRVEETRVEMSLVRLLAPGLGGSRDEEGSSNQDSAAPPALRHLDTDSTLSRDVIVRAGPRPSARSRTVPLGDRAILEPSHLIAAIPTPLGPEDQGAEIPWITAAALPPIDGPDRARSAAPTIRSGDAADRGERVDSRKGPVGAIFLGLSGSAVLGVGLYAPDLASAIRRAVPGPVPRSPSRPSSNGDEETPA